MIKLEKPGLGIWGVWDFSFPQSYLQKQKLSQSHFFSKNHEFQKKENFSVEKKK